MSLDIYLTDGDGNGMEMNWLRNPFGLCNWIEDNVHEMGHEPPKDRSLYYVINHWNYDKSENVDRKLFLSVIMEYKEVVDAIEVGYFFFSFSSYRQFIEGKTHLMTIENIPLVGERIKGEKYSKGGRWLMIPVENLKHPDFNLSDPSLGYYKQWFGKLVAFAELLQNEQYEFYCSN